jgi:shikimate kinase
MRIVLTGYRGCGKTAVGKKLAERLGLPFLDTDALIAERAGRTIREIVKDGGWEEFRALERQVIAGLPLVQSVVALGGGAVLDPANVKSLKKEGFFVWLTAEPDVLTERLTADVETAEQRPPLAGGGARAEMERVLRERLPLYRRVADMTVDTSRLLPAEVVEKIIVSVG